MPTFDSKKQKLIDSAIRWLISDQAQRWVARVAADPDSTLRHSAALRADLSAARTHLVLELVELLYKDIFLKGLI